MSDTAWYRVAALCGLISLLGVSLAVVMALRGHDGWEKSCFERGGRVVTWQDPETAVTRCVGPNGEMWGVR